MTGNDRCQAVPASAGMTGVSRPELEKCLAPKVEASAEYPQDPARIPEHEGFE